MNKRHSLLFDAKDYQLLEVVNSFIERSATDADREQQRLFRTTLHPHGIKELSVTKELRIAQAVIDLLGSLEAGKMPDRINALQTLHDEVLYSETSSFRYNTGRALIQLMKSLIRAYGRPEEQLRLAHDFRQAASGKRRIVRSILKRYHLLEMPEEWNQIAFDHHVHDANTKGRKTATHLIMDAWIKGIRKLHVIYYNYVEPAAVEELLKAAAIMGTEVLIGIEFQAFFRNRHVQFVWEPTGFQNYTEFLEFLEEKSTCSLMNMGKLASQFHHEYVLKLLARYNSTLRHDIGKQYGLEMTPISEVDISSLVGKGQTSCTHLAELIYRQLRNHFQEQLEPLREEYKKADAKARSKIDVQIEAMNAITPDAITSEWLGIAKNPDIRLPRYSDDSPNVPEIMRLAPPTLIEWLASVRSPSNIVLNLNSLTTEDVLELLYVCNGRITHLELFNHKNYSAGRMRHIPAISELLGAINEGSAIALKRLIRTIIKSFEDGQRKSECERCEAFSEILKNIPRFQSFYSAKPLKTRIGSDSTSRATRQHGMGFIFPETLPPRARKLIESKSDHRETIPLSQAVYPCTTMYPQPFQKLGLPLTRFIRKLPGMRWFAMRRHREWLQDPKTARYDEHKGNIALLGGYQFMQRRHFTMQEETLSPLALTSGYLNSTTKNILKVLLGFSLTLATFQFTQSWWFLMWFGPLIWFGITGFRNIIQSILGSGGIRSTPLLRWNDYVSWSRLCDSLMYTGFSVPLLELGFRYFILGQLLEITATSNPVIFYTIVSAVNGFYISMHNIYRGFPQEAIIGNLFRSFLAIPVSVFYGSIAYEVAFLAGASTLLVDQSAAVISKLASDSVAGAIEGFADKVECLRIRNWDYTAKLNQLFSTFSRLEVLMPDEDLIEVFCAKGGPTAIFHNATTENLERTIIICSLDLMYFWMYLPRARSLLRDRLRHMTKEEIAIFMHSQGVLRDVHKVSQLFVDGLVGSSFARPLSFYLAKYDEYLADMEKLARFPICSSAITTKECGKKVA